MAGMATTGASAVSGTTSGAAVSGSELPSSMNYHASFQGEIERATDADVILQLKVNLARLADLHGRMRFLMGELGYLLKADSAADNFTGTFTDTTQF